MSLVTGRKVFGIGFQKSGTTSLAHAMRYLGFHNIPAVGYRLEFLEGISRGVHPGELTKILEPWNFLRDNPFFWPKLPSTGAPFYQWANQQYPDALFILTKRISASAWQRSMITHMERGGHYPKGPLKGSDIYKKRMLVYGQEAVDSMDISLFTKVYETYNKEARDYLSTFAKGRWIELCWEEGHGWTELCRFLSVRKPWFRPFPSSNKTNYAKHKKTIEEDT
ncbi:MAG: sulfotransferase [Candidatus Methylacidiphilales bacterium]|nr:sulfotransferase [Candidatus Methylacidiphilales bacterium]